MARPTIFYTDGFDDYEDTTQAGGSGYWPYNPQDAQWSLTTGRKEYKLNAQFNNALGILGRPVPAGAGTYLQAGLAVRRETSNYKNILRFRQNTTGGSRPAGNDTNAGLWLNVNEIGQLALSCGLATATFTALGLTDQTIGQNEWHYIEMAAKFGKSNDGWVKVWLNGALVISVENVNTTKVMGADVWGAVEIHDSNSSGILRVDDLYLGVADSTYATAAAFGDSRIYSFLPTDSVDVTDWTNEGGAADIPAALADTDDETYAETEAVGTDLLVETDNDFDVEPREIHAVTLAVRPRKTDTGVVTIKPKLGTTSGAVTPDEPHFLSESFEGVQWTFAQNPETSAAWDPEDFADFVFGLHVVDPEA